MIILLKIIKYFLEGKLRIHGWPVFSLTTNLRIGKNSKVALMGRARCRDFCLVSAQNGGQIHIGNNFFANRFCSINAHQKITIGDNVLLGENVMIYDHNHKFAADYGVYSHDFLTSEVIIGNNCWIGSGSIILKGVIIGDNCIVGAGSTVTKSMPCNSKFISNKLTKLK